MELRFAIHQVSILFCDICFSSLFGNALVFFNDIIQEEIFEETKGLAESSMNGYNVRYVLLPSGVHGLNVGVALLSEL